MLNIYRPTDAEIREEACCALRARIGMPVPGEGGLKRPVSLSKEIGPVPVPYDKPAYRTPGYSLAFAVGWISEEEERSDRATYEARRDRSLQTCHRGSLYERPRVKSPKESGAYVPQLAARVEDDRNLTDGARRCARKLAELTYRSDREGRRLEVTVTYLMKGLGRCRRTVQRYLRLLEKEGYIHCYVESGDRSRMCVGLIIQLLGPLFARHHRKGWPGRLGNSGATQESQNHRVRNKEEKKQVIVARNIWAIKCMNGVYQSLMKTLPLFDAVLSPPK